MSQVYEKLMQCYECVKGKLPFKPEVALVLGSGLGDSADQFEVEASSDYHEIEGESGQADYMPSGTRALL